MNYLLEVGGRVRIHEIKEDSLIELASGYTVGQVISQIGLSEESNIFVLTNEQIPQLTDLVRVNAKIYQLSDKFSYHDAMVWASSRNPEKVYFIEGVGTNSEVFSIYANNKVLLRAFGINKSPSAFVKGVLALIGLEQILPYADRHPKTAEITAVAAKLASQMYKNIISINLLNTEFDMLTSTGAGIAYGLHCETILKQIKKDCSMNIFDKQLVCNVLHQTIEYLVILLKTHFGDLDKEIIAIGDIFSVINGLDIKTEKNRHAVFGMLNYLDNLSTYDI